MQAHLDLAGIQFKCKTASIDNQKKLTTYFEALNKLRSLDDEKLRHEFRARVREIYQFYEQKKLPLGNFPDYKPAIEKTINIFDEMKGSYSTLLWQSRGLIKQIMKGQRPQPKDLPPVLIKPAEEALKNNPNNKNNQKVFIQITCDAEYDLVLLIIKFGDYFFHQRKVPFANRWVQLFFTSTNLPIIKERRDHKILKLIKELQAYDLQTTQTSQSKIVTLLPTTVDAKTQTLATITPTDSTASQPPKTVTQTVYPEQITISEPRPCFSSK